MKFVFHIILYIVSESKDWLASISINLIANTVYLFLIFRGGLKVILIIAQYTVRTTKFRSADYAI